MNIHVSKEIKEKWPQYEYIGTIFEVNGKKYIRAIFKVWNNTHFYDFENDFFWFDRPSSDRPENTRL